MGTADFFASLQRDNTGGQNFGQLRHYAIEDLFGSFPRNFSLDREEPTILTGVNGAGKSTVLRTIEMVSQTRWHDLAKIPFSRLALHFDQADILVTQQSDGLRIQLDSLVSEGGEWNFETTSRSRDVELRHLRNLLAHQELTYEEAANVARSFGRDVQEILDPVSSTGHQEWSSEISSHFPALLVSDQRLATNSRRARTKKRGAGETVDVVSAIEAAFFDIGESVRSYQSLYAAESQDLDREFPRRVLDAMHVRRERPGLAGLKNIERDFEILTSLQRGLSATGLVDAAEIEPLSNLRLDTPEALPVISTYVKDTIKKLRTFDPLRERLEPFVYFLNRHYKNKMVGISKEGNLRVVGRNGEEILPTQLSSGEQQILILAHRVLFEAAPGTLVMIDEPELSLHVLWLSTFIDDLTEMSSVTGCHFLLATHSPTLVAGRNDLRRSLDG